MRRRTLLVSLMVGVGGMIAAAPASAQQSPGGCTNNGLDVDINRDRTLVKNGDVINYRVDVDNVGNNVCDVSNISLWLYLPAPDGTSTGQALQLTNRQGYKAGASGISFGPFSYVVNANPGISRLEARVTVVDGFLHDGDPFSDVDINKTIGSTIPKPAIEVDKVGSIQSGQAPATVTYTFTVYNRTSPPAPLANVSLSDSLCSGAAYTSGDNGDGILQPAEAWVYTCTMTHPTPGEYPNTASACGQLYLNGSAGGDKVCDTDDWKVTLTPPPPPPAPQVAVKPASATQAPCTLSTPKGLTVRAGQLNTIKVTVRNVDAGSKVSLTIPGGKVVSAKTDKKGLATLRVRPTKTGRATIKVAECSKVKRLTVRPARRVAAKRVPQVTG